MERYLNIITYIVVGIALSISTLIAYGLFWLSVQVLREIF